MSFDGRSIAIELLKELQSAAFEGFEPRAESLLEAMEDAAAGGITEVDAFLRVIGVVLVDWSEGSARPLAEIEAALDGAEMVPARRRWRR